MNDREIKTWCHGCGGAGWIESPVFAATLDRKLAGTALQRRECPTCKGTGRLKGLVPPV